MQRYGRVAIAGLKMTYVYKYVKIFIYFNNKILI